MFVPKYSIGKQLNGLRHLTYVIEFSLNRILTTISKFPTFKSDLANAEICTSHDFFEGPLGNCYFICNPY
jgi:hypothetical protein